MASDPKRRPHTSLPVHAWGEWDTSVSKVKAALRSMENGNFAQAAQLADAMGRDDRVAGVYETRVQGLLGLPIAFEPHGDARRAKAVAKDVEARFWTMFPEAQLADLQQWGLKLGVGIGQLVYEKDGRSWEPRLETWWPGYVDWRWDTRSFWVQTAEGPVEVTPGDGKWVVYAPYGLERGWMNGAVRRLAIPWLIRQWARRDWARYSEVHGIPARMAKVPSAAPKVEKDEFLDQVASLGSEPTVLLPQGSGDAPSFDLELLEAVANTWEGFDRLLTHCDASIAFTVLGRGITGDSENGSRGAVQVEDEVRLERKQFDAETLSTTIHQHALAPFAGFNFGDRELAPYPCWQTDPPADKGKSATTLNALGDALTKLKAAAVGDDLRIDTAAILDEFGVPTKRGAAPEPVADPEPGDDEDDKPAKLSADEEPTYIDDVGDSTVRAGRKALRSDLETVLTAIESATSFDELRAKLPDLLAAMDPAAIGELTRDATLLALLAGRHAAPGG